jgi:mannose-6-phosphate isomerase-like protein (cupin superfamily)
MAQPWTTADLPEQPDQMSPSGASEIRLLPGFAAGELAHATVAPKHTAKSAVLSGMSEFYFVLEGRGELWRRRDSFEETVDLVPGRCASIPSGVSFQYKTTAESLTFIVASLPRWTRESWHEAPLARWPDGLEERTAPPAHFPWETKDLASDADYDAPDSSEIRLLLSTSAGGLAEARLQAGAVSAPVRHGTVEEIWFVLEGEGELWRASEDEAEVVDLRKGRCATIPRSVAFQFRAHGASALRVLIATFPQWPGAHEATPPWLPEYTPGR